VWLLGKFFSSYFKVYGGDILCGWGINVVSDSNDTNLAGFRAMRVTIQSEELAPARQLRGEHSSIPFRTLFLYLYSM